VTIEAIVRRAFANTVPPSSAIFSTAHDEGAANLLEKARWEDIQPGQLRLHSAAVNFLTPPAFAYFLPAFIVASLSEPGVRDSLLESILPPKADTSRPSFAAWWRPLSVQQKQAIIAFVEHCMSEGYLSATASLDALKADCGPNNSLERTRDG
jgi:hypothetical protein